MNHIKSYRLFESIEEKSMLDKIKSYSYILQDDGYEAIYYTKAYTKMGEIPLESDIVTKHMGNTWEYEEIEQPLDSHVVSVILEIVILYGDTRYAWDKALIKIFSNQLDQIITQFKLIFTEYNVVSSSNQSRPIIEFTKKKKTD